MNRKTTFFIYLLLSPPLVNLTAHNSTFYMIKTNSQSNHEKRLLYYLIDISTQRIVTHACYDELTK